MTTNPSKATTPVIQTAYGLPYCHVLTKYSPPACHPSCTCTTCSADEFAVEVSTSTNGVLNVNGDGVLPVLDPHTVAS